MKVMRKMEGTINKEVGFKVGDQIQVGKYTATCQKVGKKGAIFCMDRYLDEDRPMNTQRTNEGGYEASDLRKYLQALSADEMFAEIKEMMVPFKNGDLLRIPTAEEMFGPEEAHEYYEALNNKKQWSLMKDRHNRIAFRKDEQELEWGWLQNKYKDSAAGFALVISYGLAAAVYASDAIGVRVVFRLLV